MDTGRLAGAVVEAANEERRRIARDLHDGLQISCSKSRRQLESPNSRGPCSSPRCRAGGDRRRPGPNAPGSGTHPRTSRIRDRRRRPRSRRARTGDPHASAPTSSSPTVEWWHAQLDWVEQHRATLTRPESSHRRRSHRHTQLFEGLTKVSEFELSGARLADLQYRCSQVRDA